VIRLLRGVQHRIWRQCYKRKTPDWRVVRRQGIRWVLRQDYYLDRELLLNGVFEERTTALLYANIQEGMNAIDVGANFGYFTLILARLVGATGHVCAFEPTNHYRQRLNRHLVANGSPINVSVFPFGLSDAVRDTQIGLVESSASCHNPENTELFGTETIALRRLDDLFSAGLVPKANFVKVDIDGHEPFFFAGATELLQATRPILLVEFSESNLEVAGSSALALKEQIESIEYTLFSESTGEPFSSRFAFLQECGNYSHSANVWAIPAERGLSSLTQPWSEATGLTRTLRPASQEPPTS
jgi:FkbM family methyltransferase